MNSANLRIAIPIVCAISAQFVVAEYATNYADVDVSRWQCLLCEFENHRGTAGQLTVASIRTTNDSDRFGRNGSFYRAGSRSTLNARAGINSTNGWTVSASATDVGLDSSNIAFDIRNSQSLEANVRFQQYRHLTESRALTPFLDRDGRLTLGSNWHRSVETQDFSSLATSNRVTELATTRRLLDATVSVEPLPSFELLFNHRSMSKEGTQGTFRDDIFRSTGLPRVVDQASSAQRFQVSYRGQYSITTWTRSKSTFQNNEPVLHWESPYRFGLLENESANALSHEHHSETLDIRFTLPRNSMLRIHERRGNTESMPRLLNYGFGTLIKDTQPVNVFAEREYRSRRLSLATKFSRDFEVSASYLKYELKDARPFKELTPALGGVFLTPPVVVRSGDLKRNDAEIGLSYRRKGARVTSRIFENSLTRANQEITNNTTRGLEATWVQPILDRWEAFSTFRRELRGASEFKAVTKNNVYTRRFHQAEMKRQVWSGGTTYRFKAGENHVSFELDAERREFPDSLLGLSDLEIRGLSLEYGLQVNDRTLLSGYIATHRRFVLIDGSQDFDLSMLWSYSAHDIVDSAGLNIKIQPYNALVDNLLFTYKLSDGEASLSTTSSESASFFPDQLSRHESIALSVGFSAVFGAEVTASVYIEDYGARDWSIDNVTQTTLPNVLSLAYDNPPYRNALFSLQIRRSF